MIIEPNTTNHYIHTLNKNLGRRRKEHKQQNKQTPHHPPTMDSIKIYVRVCQEQQQLEQDSTSRDEVIEISKDTTLEEVKGAFLAAADVAEDDEDAVVLTLRTSDGAIVPISAKLESNTENNRYVLDVYQSWVILDLIRIFFFLAGREREIWLSVCYFLFHSIPYSFSVINQVTYSSSVRDGTVFDRQARSKRIH